MKRYTRARRRFDVAEPDPATRLRVIREVMARTGTNDWFGPTPTPEDQLTWGFVVQVRAWVARARRDFQQEVAGA